VARRLVTANIRLSNSQEVLRLIQRLQDEVPDGSVAEVLCVTTGYLGGGELYVDEGVYSIHLY
jgi:hypothetical protein